MLSPKAAVPSLQYGYWASKLIGFRLSSGYRVLGFWGWVWGLVFGVLRGLGFRLERLGFGAERLGIGV